MNGLVEKANRFFDLPLTVRSRILVLAGALFLIPTFILPLWRMTLYSNQFPDGLELYIYTHTLDGGHPRGRDDLREISTLNHYIGMRPLLESDFSEFKWMPLLIGIFLILALRSAPVKVAPFTPPLIGSKRLANFTVYSYPGAASYFLVAFVLLLVLGVLFSSRKAAE